MDREGIKILDKKIEHGEELYLIHKLGEHKLAARWIEKSRLINHTKHYGLIVEKYDKELDLRCKRLKNINIMNNRRMQNSSDHRRQSQQRQKNVRRGKPRQHHQQQIFENAKKEINEIVHNKTLPAQGFVLFINTPTKLQSNWVFGDKLLKVKEKLPEDKLYSVLWEDKTSSVVNQKEIIERDPRKFCEFWERKLGLSRWVNISQNTKDDIEGEEDQQMI